MSTTLKSLLGSDSDSDSDDDIGAKAKPPQPKATEDDSSDGSSSDSSSDDDDFKLKKSVPKSAPSVKKGDDSSKKRKASSSADPKKRTTNSKDKEGDEYDSEPEVKRTKADDDFIDSDDDDKELLKEYSKDRQDFHDERPDSDDDNRRGRNEDGDDQEDEPTDAFEIMMAKIKRKKKSEMSASEKDELAKAVCYAMDVAAEKDETALAKGEYALCKIKQLPVVIKQLQNEEMKEKLLEFDILKYIKLWIEPQGDVMPNLTVRTAILKALNGLHVEVDHLRSSNGLGKAINLLSHYSKETVENKTMCRHLLNKWNRLVFNKSDNFRQQASYTAHEMETNADAEKGGQGQRKVSRESSLGSLHKSPSGKLKKSSSANRRTSHIRHDLNFVKAPPPRKVVENNKDVNKDSTRGRLGRNMLMMRRPHNKSLKSMKMSIEGRVVQN